MSSGNSGDDGSTVTRRQWLAAAGSTGLTFVAGCSQNADGEGGTLTQDGSDGNGATDSDGDGATDSAGNGDTRLDVNLRGMSGTARGSWPQAEMFVPNSKFNFNFGKRVHERVTLSSSTGDYVNRGLKNFELDQDSNTLTATLKDDIYWHQNGELGRKLTSEDWLFTMRFEELVNTGYSQLYHKGEEVGDEVPYQPVTSMEAPDDKTVVFNLNPEGYNPELVTQENLVWNYLWAKPDYEPHKEAYSKLEDAALNGGEEALTTAVSEVSGMSIPLSDDPPLSGAWLVDNIAQQEVTFRLNTDHWAAEHINYSGAVVKNFSDGSQVFQAMKTNRLDEAHGIKIPRAIDIPAQVPGHMTAVAGPGTTSNGLQINWQEGADPIYHIDNLPEAAWIRQGFAYAIDAQRALKNTSQPDFVKTGRTTGLSRLTSKDVFSDEVYNQFPDYRKQDTELAAQKLQRAGCTREDGKWYKPNGERLTLDLQIFPWATNRTQSWAEDLENFGVKVEVISGEASDLVSDYWGKSYSAVAGKWDMASPPASAGVTDAFRGWNPSFGSQASNQGVSEVKIPPFGELDGEPTESFRWQDAISRVSKVPEKDLKEDIKELSWGFAWLGVGLGFNDRGTPMTLSRSRFDWPDVGERNVVKFTGEDHPIWGVGQGNADLMSAAGGIAPSAKDK